MYPYYFRKKSSRKPRTVLIEDCFAEKAKSWLWILGIIIVLVIVFSIVKFSGQINSYSGDSQAGKNISPALLKRLSDGDKNIRGSEFK